LLCVEEPENQLYPSLMGELAEEFQDYARRGGQVFVSTHSPDFLNSVPLKSLYVLTKSEGLSTVRNASEFEQVENLVEAGDHLGWLWREGVFKGVGPE
jgi:predicted ATPase